MTFTSLTFILFLALVFGLYWRLQDRRRQNLLLVAASFFFYGWWDVRFSGLMLAASLIDYFGALALDRSSSPAGRRRWLWLSIGCNLTLLGFFKYFNFFAENLQALALSLGWELHPVTLRIVLPVGISFYTFQTMGYTIDVYRGDLKPCRNLIDYLAFVTFFPQLVAGPIERATQLLPQFQAPRRFDYDQAVDGCRQILWGFLKKMVLADRLAEVVDRWYAQPHSAPGSLLVLATVCFAFQIYCDFSAYSDIALGVSRLFGIRLMRNFAYPYFSQSPAEFWRRWHISLSTWLRDYVYIPLGGSRGGPLARVRNILLTFATSGLWHGASWNFVSWGCLNGGALVPGALSGVKGSSQAAEVPGGDRLIPSPATACRMLAVFSLACVTWIFFRAATLGDALLILKKGFSSLLQPQAYAVLIEAIRADHRLGRTLTLLMALVLIEWLQRRQAHPLRLPDWPLPARWALYTGLFWLTLYYGAGVSSQFVYFQF